MNKKDFREFCINKRAKTPKINTIALNHSIEKKLKAVLKHLNHKNILSFIPLKSEYKITKLMDKSRGLFNYQVPFMVDVSFKSVKYRLPLAKKKFNIQEPPNSFKKMPKIDIAIVPVIGVDGDYARVGFGKGMYDRYFAKLKNRPITIFIQLTECFTKVSISDPHDIKADIIITPKRLHIIRKKNVNNNYSWRRLCSSCRSSRLPNCKKVR